MRSCLIHRMFTAPGQVWVHVRLCCFMREYRAENRSERSARSPSLHAQGGPSARRLVSPYAVSAQGAPHLLVSPYAVSAQGASHLHQFYLEARMEQ